MRGTSNMTLHMYDTKLAKEYEAMNKLHQKNQLCLDLAEWMLDHDSTVRELGREFMISKSAAHYKIVRDLKELDTDLHKQCLMVLARHKEDRIYRMVKARRRML